MYEPFYNLSEKPFQISTDPDYLWLGSKHKEALANLEYGLTSQNGFLLLTGDVGAGKTTLINALLKKLSNNILVANVTNPDLELMDFFNHIAKSLKIPQRFETKTEFLFSFEDFLKKCCRENRHVLLIIDEAHRLSETLLEEIRLLSNIELPKKKIINIFFVGQNEINQTLKSSQCRAVRQRISLNHNIKPLSETETAQYIRHRLKVAGTEVKIFKKKSIHEIHRFSGGYPRLINIICDRALLTGYVRSSPKITPNMISECAQELLLPDEAKEDSHFNVPRKLSTADSAPILYQVSAEPADTVSEKPRRHRRSLEDQQPSPGGAEPIEQSTVKRLWAIVLDSILDNKRRFPDYVAPARSHVKRYWESVLKYASVVHSHGKRIWESALELKEPGLEYVSAARAFVKNTWESKWKGNNRRLTYGIVMGAVVTIIVFSGIFYRSSNSNSDQHKPALRESNTSTPTKNDASLSILQEQEPSEKESLTLATERLSTKEQVESKLALLSVTHQATPSKTGIPDSIQGKGPVSSTLLKDSQQELTDSNIKTDSYSIDGELKTVESDLLEQAREALAKTDFNHAVDLLENDLTKRKEIRTLHVQALRGQAGLLIKEDTAQAEKLLLKAIDIDNQNDSTYFDLGKLYTNTKDYPKAIEAYLKASELNPNSANAFFNLGFNYAAIKNYEPAEKMFNRAIELSPPYLDEAIFNLAMVQYKQGKKKQCLENLEKTLKVNPDNQRAKKYLDRFSGVESRLQ